MTRPPVGDPLRVGGQARSVRVEVEAVAQPSPQALAAHGDLHRAVAAAEQPVRRDRRVVVALRVTDLAGHGPAGALEGVHPDDRGEQRGADDGADAGAAPLVERGHARRRRRTSRTSRSAIGTPDPLRVVGPGAGQRHQAGLALGDLVVARAPALGPVVAEAGDRQHDQPRVALVQRRDPEAEPLEDAGAEVLDQHVGPVDQAQQDLVVGLVLEVEGDRLLVAVGREEVRRLPGARVRRRTAAPSRGCRRRARAPRP